jgi:hypothetical protein
MVRVTPATSSVMRSLRLYACSSLLAPSWTTLLTETAAVHAPVGVSPGSSHLMRWSTSMRSWAIVAAWVVWRPRLPCFMATICMVESDSRPMPSRVRAIIVSIRVNPPRRAFS